MWKKLKGCSNTHSHLVHNILHYRKRNLSNLSFQEICPLDVSNNNIKKKERIIFLKL